MTELIEFAVGSWRRMTHAGVGTILYSAIAGAMFASVFLLSDTDIPHMVARAISIALCIQQAAYQLDRVRRGE